MQSAATVKKIPEKKASPLTAAEFEQAMVRLAPSNQKIGIAVSGGPDSMALALLAKEWAEPRGVGLHAFIVDHALRPTSANEAKATQEQLQKCGIAADILTWKHGPILSRLHITARKARYKLLAEACTAQGISDLLLAHQIEDQAETILMRLAKGSGVEGLSGIAPQSRIGGLRLLRPLLAFPKERLIATCEAASVSYILDSSNLSARFARGRLRRVMPLLAEEGLTLERLLGLGVRAREASDALHHYTQIFLQQSVTQDSAGCFLIDRMALRVLPRAIASRAVTFILQDITRQDYAPEHASLVPLLDELCGGREMPPRTLHGCLMSAMDQHVFMLRELAAIADSLPIAPGETLVWDSRWQVTLASEAGQSYIVRPLGNPPHELLDKLAPDLRRKIPQGRVRACLPAFWTSDKANAQLALIPDLTLDGGIRRSSARILQRG